MSKGKNVSLIGKLGLEEPPTITVTENVVVTVDNSAQTIIQALELLDDGSVGSMFKVANLLFDEKSRKALDKLKLSFDDYSTVVEAAINLILGRAEGESKTQATTS